MTTTDDDSYLATVDVDDFEWRGICELAKAPMEFQLLVTGSYALGATVAYFLVSRGLAERGRPAGSEPAKSTNRFKEWASNILKPERSRVPPGYRLTELGRKVRDRGQYAKRG